MCCSSRFRGKWLWDSEIGGGGKVNEVGETAKNKADRHEAAKTVCRSCPIRSGCLADALADPHAEGIRGGELFPLFARTLGRT